MKSRITRWQRGLYLIPAIILLVGMGGAAFIYLTAEDRSDSLPGLEGEGGYGYPVIPEDSKTYMHNLELYGGKANVLASEFRHWFAGLWHGKSLAFTVASVSILTALGFFLLARSKSVSRRR